MKIPSSQKHGGSQPMIFQVRQCLHHTPQEVIGFLDGEAATEDGDDGMDAILNDVAATENPSNQPWECVELVERIQRVLKKERNA